jgi:hypothetical protein
MNNVYKVEEFLLPSEIEIVNEAIANSMHLQDDNNLGRIIIGIGFPDSVIEAIQERTERLLNKKLRPMSVSYVEYRLEHGQPNLPPHFDGDNNDLIIDYQLKSNTSWDLGVDGKLFDMNDNNALIFNPNEYPHWRPHKTFTEGEYVGMIFFRFPDLSWTEVDYSNKRLSQQDNAFDEARSLRDSL